MNEEEMQQTMRFIVEQQAQFAVNVQRLQEAQAKTDDRADKLEDLVVRLAAVTHAGFQEVRDSISALVDSQMRTEESIKNLSAVVQEVRESISALVDSQMQTEESIKNLTAVVDRYFSKGRNGG